MYKDAKINKALNDNATVKEIFKMFPDYRLVDGELVNKKNKNKKKSSKDVEKAIKSIAEETKKRSSRLEKIQNNKKDQNELILEYISENSEFDTIDMVIEYAMPIYTAILAGKDDLIERLFELNLSRVADITEVN